MIHNGGCPFDLVQGGEPVEPYLTGTGQLSLRFTFHEEHDTQSVPTACRNLQEHQTRMNDGEHARDVAQTRERLTQKDPVIPSKGNNCTYAFTIILRRTNPPVAAGSAAHRSPFDSELWVLGSMLHGQFQISSFRTT